VILHKEFFTSKFGYLLFCNPRIKLKVGHQKGGGTTNSKSLGAIIMMSQSETLSRNQIIFITLLAESVAAPFTSHSKLYNYHEPKPIS
jgi:hypothetical protein